jgi:YegS/Rv2252/BmrU family lipid kinase
MKTRLIVNAASARGNRVRQYSLIETTLREENLHFETIFTAYRGHATELAQTALLDGCDLIVAVGGDGTLNEVVNGMVAQDGKAINPDARLGLVPLGTGLDFARTANIPSDVCNAVRRLARATKDIPLDLGKITFFQEGKPAVRFFVNVSGMGFDAEVIARLEGIGKRGVGTIPYFRALLAAVSSFHNFELKITLDGRIIQGKINPIIVCNGKYFGGGMKICPNSILNDGKFHVMLGHDFTALELLLATPRLYTGSILRHPKATEHVARTVTVESSDAILIEADGELIGEGPAAFEIMPAALKLR